MQNPTKKTPVSKCLDLATYSIRMFGKFSTNVVLTALAAEMTTVKTHLATTQEQYESAVKEVLVARVDVKYENHASDRRIRLTQQKVEIADGKKGGRIAALVFKDGSAPITRLLGDSQIQAMSDLEGLLDSAVTLWPEAADEKIDIAKHRESYDNALKYRKQLRQVARDKRALRDAAKEAYITKYAAITSRVEAEFPRDNAMQDLFFDDVRSKSALAQADEDGNDDANDEDNAGESNKG